MTKRFTTGIACALLATSLAACVRAPTVDLTSVRVESIGLRGASLVASLVIQNPNPYALASDSIAFELEAGDGTNDQRWTRVTAGTYAERIRVPGNGTASVEVPIDLAYGSLAGPARALIGQGRFNYRVNGQVFVRRPLPRRVPFSDQGSLSIF